MDKLDQIIKNINERMSKYSSSQQPTDDEVTIAWLVSECKVTRGLQKRVAILEVQMKLLTQFMEIQVSTNKEVIDVIKLIKESL